MLTEAFLMLLRNDNTTARGNQAKSYRLPLNRKPTAARHSAQPGLSLRLNFAPSGAKQIGIISKSPGIRAEFRAFRASFARPKTPLAERTCKKDQSADWSLLCAERSAGPHRPAAPRPGGRPPLALKGRRGLSGQTRPDLISCLYTAPPRRRGCPARRRTRRRAASRPAS